MPRTMAGDEADERYAMRAVVTSLEATVPASDAIRGKSFRWLELTKGEMRRTSRSSKVCPIATR